MKQLYKCRLCNKPCAHFARSHLIPWGLQSQCKYANDMTLVAAGRRSRRLRKGVYDSNILCDDCEHRYFHDPDTYAIEIFRDFSRGKREEICSMDGTRSFYYIIKNVDRRLLRAFFASVLWRCSVSALDCVSNVSIGRTFEERIAHDLMQDGLFNWVDAVGIVFDSSGQDKIIQGMNTGYILPDRTRIRYANRVANGYNICFPNMKFCVSLDKRVNPFAMMGDELAKISSMFVNVSPSLAQESDGKDLIIFGSDFPDSIARTMALACRNATK